MAIQTEVWARDIAEKLFPADTFVMDSVSDDMWVDNKTVHRPQAGALPTVERNRSTFPAPLVKRTDTDNTYNLDEFTSTPSLIQDIEEIETSYAKRTSVLQNHINEQNKQIANYLQWVWAATGSANIIRTSGDATDANTVGATGTRKKLTVQDIMDARKKMDDMDIPEAGRCLLLPASMYNNLIIDEKAILMSKDFRGAADMSNGVLNMLLGFKIYKRGRNNVLRYTNAATPVKKDSTAAGAATDNAAALVWHKEFVAKAKGSIKVYADEDKPEYYGSVFSTMVRAGGQKVYADGLGVISIVEAAG